MDIEQRYVVAYLHRKNSTIEEIHEQLMETYGGESLSKYQVKYWVHEVILQRENLHDRPGIEKVRDEGITIAVQMMVENDPLISAHKIAKTLSISINTVIDRLKNVLGYKCLHTRWVPHLLSKEQKKKKNRNFATNV